MVVATVTVTSTRRAQSSIGLGNWQAAVILKHKNVSSIEEYNIGDRLKYSRIKQSSKKDIEESRINAKYQNITEVSESTKCKVQSAI